MYEHIGMKSGFPKMSQYLLNNQPVRLTREANLS
jgi:hypothetical protein